MLPSEGSCTLRAHSPRFSIDSDDVFVLSNDSFDLNRDEEGKALLKFNASEISVVENNKKIKFVLCSLTLGN